MMRVLLIILVRKRSLSGRHQRDLSCGNTKKGYRLKMSDRSWIPRVLLNFIIPLLPRLAERAERSLSAFLCVSVCPRLAMMGPCQKLSWLGMTSMSCQTQFTLGSTFISMRGAIKAHLCWADVMSKDASTKCHVELQSLFFYSPIVWRRVCSVVGTTSYSSWFLMYGSMADYMQFRQSRSVYDAWPRFCRALKLCYLPCLYWFRTRQLVENN